MTVLGSMSTPLITPWAPSDNSAIPVTDHAAKRYIDRVLHEELSQKNSVVAERRRRIKIDRAKQAIRDKIGTLKVVSHFEEYRLPLGEFVAVIKDGTVVTVI
ncbi:MAG: hypothetical protein ABL901_20020 [Hyphomicrobiaceae bacterium]